MPERRYTRATAVSRERALAEVRNASVTRILWPRDGNVSRDSLRLTRMRDVTRGDAQWGQMAIYYSKIATDRNS